MKAMILAAGRGERMRPLTDALPKPLLAVGGKPLIVWHIERLAAAGFRELVINQAHLGHLLEERLGDGAAWGVRIAWSAEAEALETAGGIANALALLGPEPFLVVNGDIWCDYDFSRAHRVAQSLVSGGLLAHLVLVPNPPHHPRGDFALAGDRCRAHGEPRLTFSGIGVYAPQLFAGVVRGSKAPLAPLLVRAMHAGRCSGERHGGAWEDVGTPRRLAELDAALGVAILNQPCGEP